MNHMQCIMVCLSPLIAKRVYLVLSITPLGSQVYQHYPHGSQHLAHIKTITKNHRGVCDDAKYTLSRSSWLVDVCLTWYSS